MHAQQGSREIARRLFARQHLDASCSSARSTGAKSRSGRLGWPGPIDGRSSRDGSRKRCQIGRFLAAFFRGDRSPKHRPNAALSHKRFSRPGPDQFGMGSLAQVAPDAFSALGIRPALAQGARINTKPFSALETVAQQVLPPACSPRVPCRERAQRSSA